ncbi:alkaline phosphatase family protein [Nocardia arthritidis]|uniref:alkaline phosphatase family protein n=1 Tax=Nocardia arthritidis TaxID=228602 RepID=UPI001EEC42F6|nr:alkaline phosphatase family protein [Nocardia arthritidis]
MAASLIALTAATVSGPTAHADAATNKLVVIGLDGTMYDKVEKVGAPNLLKLSEQGTLSRYSISPHITISGPSWATTLTGVWDTKHGITNNDFDAKPFAKWPTVFTRLEKADPNLKTASIATWGKIETIAGSGNPHADIVRTTPAVPGDADESKTDTATADGAIEQIDQGTDFLFTHLDQVDEAGHAHGTWSSEYRNAIKRVDTEVGRIVAAVDKRAAANPKERWTILVTTDHGHVPWGGHGGQTPWETASFLIARGPDFRAGATTAGAYSFVDITPTALDLLGAPPATGLDGVSMVGRPVGADGGLPAQSPEGPTKADTQPDGLARSSDH